MRTLLRLFSSTLRYWLLVSMIIVGFYVSLYVVVQQVLRQGANSPQIQMAEDAANKLSANQSLQSVLPSGTIDISMSLAPYIIIFDTHGTPIASSALLDGKMPSIPEGVFDNVRKNGEDRFTWEPQSGIRSAVVVTQFHGTTSGFVLAGRSLREVEQIDSNIFQLICTGMIAMLVIMLPITAFVFRQPVKQGPVY